MNDYTLSSAPTKSPATTMFTDPKGDIFIKSDDAVSDAPHIFQVSRKLLSSSSEFLAGMFELTPDGTITQGTKENPIVFASDDSETIDAVLRYLYPTPNPSFGIELLGKSLHFTHKWLMDDAHQNLMNALINPTVLGEAPVEAFLLAHKYNAPPHISRTAASATISCDLTSIILKTYDPSYSPQHSSLQELALYHTNQKTKFLQVLDELDTKEIYPYAGYGGDNWKIWWRVPICNCITESAKLSGTKEGHPNFYPPRWLRSFVSLARAEVAKSFCIHVVSRITSPAFMLTAVSECGCKQCASHVLRFDKKIEKIREQLVNILES